jgi:hydrogenase-4 membrane subunit HyfE
MLSEWSQFAERHWIVGGILVSLLWFVAGKQSFSNRKADTAMFWQSVAVLIILVVCGWALVEKQWLGLGFAVVVLCVEAGSIRRSYATRGSSSSQQ